jgi:curved DNA-binding protein CbpA
MDNYYGLLGISQNASYQEIKRAFREKAKRLHPDIAGNAAVNEMQRLISAYEVLSNRERRSEYDRAFIRSKKKEFDYRMFLSEQRDDPASQAKLVLFELFNNHEEAALALWHAQGGLTFSMKQYLDRGDWMDGAYVLAEELEKQQYYYEAFILLAELLREERRLPYFKHFSVDLETFLKELVYRHLASLVDEENWGLCLETLLDLEFPPHDEARWLRSLAESLFIFGKLAEARAVFHQALSLDPDLPNIKRLQKRLKTT